MAPSHSRSSGDCCYAPGSLERAIVVAALEPFGRSSVTSTSSTRCVDARTTRAPSHAAPRSSLMTSGAVTARLDRLERAGLVTRA